MLAALPPLALLSACSAAPQPGAAASFARGDQVVSLDYCADQMVLGLVPRDRILAVSPEADSDGAFSALRAQGIARVRPTVEEIARLRPRFAVRLYGGAPAIDRQLRAMGVTVVQLASPDRLSDVPGELRRVGKLLAAGRRADELIAEWRRNVATLPARAGRRPTLLYITPGDVTAGRDGFVGDLIHATGFQSVRTATGWGSLPLETMVRRPPDAVLRAFFDNIRYRQDHWSSSAHPRLQQSIAGVPTLTATGSALGCGNWLAGDTIRKMSTLRARLERGQ